MHETIAGDKYFVLHNNMATDQSTIRCNYFIADPGVMSHMAPGHEVVFGPYYSILLGFIRAVNRYMLTESIFIPHFQASWSSLIFQVLGMISDYTPAVKAVPIASLYIPANVNIRLKVA